ncbi:MAG: carbohydrate kinase, partial [Acidobacteria bacterium]|nr:carbohydrate kinase [Acidobacteriota bacterium]
KKFDEPADDSLPVIVGLGELTWDLLPGGKQLGGPATNFAHLSRLLGNQAAVASRVGRDELGREALARLRERGIITSYIQVDETHPTGTVGVRIGERGEALYSLNLNSAWDYLEWSDEWEELAGRAHAVGFGTLGQRERVARETITRFLERTRPETLRIFDVNLCHAFFTTEMLTKSLELATIVKLNHKELHTVARMLGLDAAGEEALCRQLMQKFEIALVAVTRAEHGSLLITAEESHDHPGFAARVADTIGAGDAFTAALVHFYLRGEPLERINEAANRLGSWLATHTGATPEASPQTLQRVLGDLLS